MSKGPACKHCLEVCAMCPCSPEHHGCHACALRQGWYHGGGFTRRDRGWGAAWRLGWSRGRSEELGGGLWVKLPTVVPELGAESVGRVCIYLYLLLLGEQRRLVQRIRSAVLFFPPTLSVLDEASGSAGLPALGQGYRDCEGDWGWTGSPRAVEERVTHHSARVKLLGWGCITSPGRG